SFSRDWSSDVCSSDLEGVVTNLSALSESGLYNVRISYLGVESVVRYKHFKPEAPFESGERVRVFYRKCDKKLRFIASNQTDGDRSEERRVGKECMSRW